MQNIKIPFDNEGNQLEHNPFRNTENLKDNFIFEDTLEYLEYETGRSSKSFIFKRESNGKLVNFSISKFPIKYMILGKITGKFTFQKQGGRYTCVYIEENN